MGEEEVFVDAEEGMEDGEVVLEEAEIEAVLEVVLNANSNKHY